MFWMLQRWLSLDVGENSTLMTEHFFSSARCALDVQHWPGAACKKCRELHDGKGINKPVTKVGKNPYCSATVKKPLPFHTLLTLPKRIICVFIHSFVLLTSSWNKINSAASLAL